jgi:hypothetical protein
VIAHREHVIALEPLGKGLLGTTLRILAFGAFVISTVGRISAHD